MAKLTLTFNPRYDDERIERYIGGKDEISIKFEELKNKLSQYDGWEDVDFDEDFYFTVEGESDPNSDDLYNEIEVYYIAEPRQHRARG